MNELQWIEAARQGDTSAFEALVRLYELISEGRLNPRLVIGVPVGFVNVVEAKEEVIKTIPNYIVARGRKGGSNVAAAIVNAVLYQMITREGI